MRRALLALPLLLAACIDRQPSVREARERFDRSDLGGLLFDRLPDTVDGAPAEAQGVFDGVVRLRAVELSPPVPMPGTPVDVTLWLEVLGEPEADLRLFVHLEDRAGKLERVIADHDPLGGAYPMTAWRPGEVLKDTFRVHVAPYTPPGTHLELWVGFFQGERRATITNRAEVRADGASRLLATAFVAR